MGRLQNETVKKEKKKKRYKDSRGERWIMKRWTMKWITKDETNDERWNEWLKLNNEKQNSKDEINYESRK